MSGLVLRRHSHDEVWQMIFKLLASMFLGGYLGIFEVNE